MNRSLLSIGQTKTFISLSPSPCPLPKGRGSNATVIVWSMLIAFCAMFLSTRPVGGQNLIDFDELDSKRTSFSSWARTGNSWTHTEGNAEPLSGVQPAASVLSALRVKWEPVAVEELGEIATIRGQLMYSPMAEDEFAPINWQQGVTVAVRNQPLADPNAMEPISLLSTQSVTETCITDGSGAFEVKIELDGLTRDKQKEQKFRCALSLATHSKRERLGPILVWSSDHEPLRHSYVDLVFPSNPVIDPFIEAIRVACENDFEPNSMILAVNALQPLGKKAALQRLEAFLAARGRANPHFADADGVFWILRLLFEPIELNRRIPAPMAFVRSVDSDVEPNWPLNPIVVVADIPFRFVGGGIGGTGMPEEPASHIRFVRRYCVIRDAPLIPSRDPILAAQQLIESPLVSKMPESDREDAIRDIRDQAISLLPDGRRTELPKVMNDEAWTAISKSSQTSPLAWSRVVGFQEAGD